MTIADTAAALGEAHTEANTQEADITKVIEQAEQAHAKLRVAAGGAANPLAERAVGSYTDAIVKLREGAALLAEVTEILAEYARAASIDLRAGNVRRLPMNRDNVQSAADTRDEIGSGRSSCDDDEPGSPAAQK